MSCRVCPSVFGAGFGSERDAAVPDLVLGFDFSNFSLGESNPLSEVEPFFHGVESFFHGIDPCI